MRSEADSDGWRFRFYALHLWTIFGIALSNAFLAAAGISALRKPRRFTRAWHAARHLRAPFLLYTFLFVLAVGLSTDFRTSASELDELLSLVSLPLAYVLVRGRRQVRVVIDGICLVVGACALYGIGQLFFGYGDISHRIPGPFSHYMTFAGVLLIVDFLVIAQVVSRRIIWRNWRWLALGAINLALVATLTRSAWVAFGLTLVVLALIRAPRSLLLLVPAAALFVVLSPQLVRERMFSIVDLRHPTNYDRLCMTEAGLHMIAERPLLGIGPGLVPTRYPIYRQPTATSYTVEHLHSSFLQIAAEQGLPAIGAYLWLMATALIGCWRRYRRARATDGLDDDLYLGIFLALIAFHLAGLFEANWRDTEIQRLVLFLAPAVFLIGEPAEPAEHAEVPTA